MDYLNDRQRLILDYLRQEGELAIKEIQARYQIPTATLYRDIQKLVDAGVAIRAHGRVMWNRAAPAYLEGGERCIMCGRPTSERLAFTIEMQSGEQAKACCAHCGLMALAQNPGVVSAMAADYLYSTMANVRHAFFLLESQVQVCCAPSVLVFNSRENAERFQSGFGGQVLDYPHASSEVRRMMSLQRHHSAPGE